MSAATSAVDTKINLSGPIWDAPKEKFKGWSVLTGILGTPVVENCMLNELHIRHHRSGKRDLRVIVATKEADPSCTFNMISSCRLPIYDSVENELKVIKLPTPLEVKAGQYVGVSGETSTGGIQINSLSLSSHSSIKDHTIYYGDNFSSGKKALKSWNGYLQFGFLAGEGEAAKRAAIEVAAAAAAAAEAAASST